VDAIEWEAGSEAFIVEEKCIGCGECTVACQDDAIAVNWKTDTGITQEKTAEYVAGALKNKAGKGFYFSFLINISPDCDCYGFNDPPFVADIGILASFDPVAIDQAGIDLVNGAQGMAGSKLEDPEAADKIVAVTGIDWEPILEHAETMGVGRRAYVLENVD
jgi:uncharacterized Fe-S center protein